MRSMGGSIRLRIDDMDEARCRPAYLEDIFRSLEWLGLDWDLGPFSVAEHMAHFRQRQRLPMYQEALENLRSRGQLFACDCSRKDMMDASPDGSYPGTCREKKLPFDQPDQAWRMRTPWPLSETWRDHSLGQVKILVEESLRDLVLRKKDGWPAYQLSSLIDDIHYGTTHVVRGEDLLTSTACQRWLARELENGTFSDIHFYHHGLLVETNGEKLSKSAGASSLQSRYGAGESSAPLLLAFARWMGWNDFGGTGTEDLLAYVKESGKRLFIPRS